MDIGQQEVPLRLLYVGEEKAVLYKDTIVGHVTEVAEMNLCSVDIKEDEDTALNGILDVHLEDNGERSEEDIAYLKEILTEFKDVFSRSKFDIGHATCVVHDIPTGDHQPITHPLRRIPKAYEEWVQSMIDEMKKKNLIRQ